MRFMDVSARGSSRLDAKKAAMSVMMILVFVLNFGCSKLQTGSIKDEDLSLKYKSIVASDIAKKEKVKTQISRDRGFEKYPGIGGQQFNVELKGVNILDFVDVIFGKVLKVPYVIDQGLKTQQKGLDISIKKKVTRAELYRIAIKSIEVVGYWVEEKGGCLFIYGRQEKEDRVNRVFFTVRLQHVTTDDIEDVLKGQLGDRDDVKVSGDGRRTLVISGEYYAAKRLAEMAAALDQVQQRVKVEVEVYEMALTGSVKLGFEGFVTKTVGDTVFKINQPDLGLLSVYQASLKWSDWLSGLVSLMRKDDILKTVAKPFLYCSEGYDCSFNVGSKIPVLTGTKVSSEGTSTVSSMSYQDTGIKLKINPVVISNNEIILSLSFESSKSTTNTMSKLDSPIIITRTVSNSIRINSGTPLVIAGIIYNQKESVITGIPFDNKWIEKLNSKAYDEQKTEMIIILTTSIIEDNQIENINAEIMKQFQGLKA